MARSRRARSLRFALRALVGLTVVAVLLTRADVGTLADAVRQASVALLLLGTAAFFASLLLSSLRWQAFLNPLGLTPARSSLVRLYLVGTFFNAFLPTGFGGDAYKSFVLGRGASIEAPLAAAALDRLAGLVGVSVVTLLGAAIEFAVGDQTLVTWASTGLSIAVLAGAISAIWLSSRPRGSPAARTLSPLRRRIRTFLDSFAVGARHPRALRTGAMWGLVTAGLLVAAHGFLLRAVHGDIPASALGGIVMLASLTTIIPLTINGLGFREATYVWSLGAYGVSTDRAVIFALTVLAVTLLSSAVGGIVYAVGGAPLPRSLQDVEDGRDDQQVDPHQQGADRQQHGGG